MTDTLPNGDTGGTLPYIAFRTITDLIDRMAREEPPGRIDKSYLANYSGGYQSQVIAALASLGLIDSNGTLSPQLLDLVSADEARRKEIVGELVRSRYGPLFALGPAATQQMLLDEFPKVAKVTGDTKRKAIAFFLAACTYAGISVSRHWKTPRVPPSGKTRKRGAVAPTELETEDDEAEEENPPPASTNVRELALRSGDGVVTLGVSVDLFSLSTEDRRFVFELIDKMNDYENQRALPTAGVAALTTAASPAGDTEEGG
jgi:hypothetical protein